MAYLTGYISSNLGKSELSFASIIKEAGRWRWYGNLRDAIPAN